MFLRNVKTLVMMQLKDKIDLSFTKNARKFILTALLSILKVVAVTAVIFLIFFVCRLLSVFSTAQTIPDTVLNAVFSVIMVMAIVSCTVGLTQTLYYANDNRVLLTLPVSSSQIFLSKMVLYYIFELKRNVTLTLPLFVAYGIVNGAVWYYYIWMLFCFLFISLVPVLIGAVLSIPALFISTFVSHYKWLQLLLIFIVAGLITWLLVVVISAIPPNIDIMGRWLSIRAAINDFLNKVSQITAPLYYLCLMVVGGTVAISGKLFTSYTFATFGITLAVLVALGLIAYFVAKPLFFKMASKLFEFEKPIVAPKKNKAHSAFISPYSESIKMTIRRSSELVSLIVELVLPGIAILLLNKVYAAMDTTYAGGVMTRTFNMLVLTVICLSFNARYAKVYSKEAGARNIIKTRPQQYLNTLFSRIFLRVVVAVLSVVGAVVVYASLTDMPAIQSFLFGVIVAFMTVAHLLWSAELDIVNSQAAQYQMVGDDMNNPNESKATVIGFIISLAFSGLYYFFAEDHSIMSSLIKCAILSAVLLGARIYFYVVRTKLYFREN